METLEGTVLPRNNFGWYFRPATNQYEFWWGGEQPFLNLSAEILPIMPNELADEIKMAVTLKGDRANLD